VAEMGCSGRDVAGGVVEAHRSSVRSTERGKGGEVGQLPSLCCSGGVRLVAALGFSSLLFCLLVFGCCFNNS